MATDLAIFLATSGHSGVDRIMHNLVPAFAAEGLRIELLQVRNHGPYWDELPSGVETVDLGAAHVNTALPALIGYLQRQRPRVLLCDKYKVNRAALLARALSRSDTRVAVRIGTHVSKDLERRGAWTRWSEKLSIRALYRFADAILTPSQGAADDLAALAGLPKSSVSVVHSPVITDGIEALAAEPIAHPWLQPGEPPVILGVGELSARKSFGTLIQAFAKVRKQRDCRLIIAGEGRQRDKLTALAEVLDVADHMDLLGFVKNPYPLMRQAQVFALTSDCEGMPVALIEALALGVPSVSTDCPSGPREVLADGCYGPLVEVGDADNLAVKLLQLLDRPPAADSLKQAVASYTVTSSAHQYLRALGLADADPLETGS